MIVSLRVQQLGGAVGRLEDRRVGVGLLLGSVNRLAGLEPVLAHLVNMVVVEGAEWISVVHVASIVGILDKAG